MWHPDLPSRPETSQTIREERLRHHSKILLDNLYLGVRVRIIHPSVLLEPIGAVRAAGETVGAG